MYASLPMKIHLLNFGTGQHCMWRMIHLQYLATGIATEKLNYWTLIQRSELINDLMKVQIQLFACQEIKNQALKIRRALTRNGDDKTIGLLYKPIQYPSKKKIYHP